MRKGEKSDRTFWKHGRRLLSFQCKEKWRKEEIVIASSNCWTIFSRYLRPEKMTEIGVGERAKNNVPHLLQAQTCLSVGQYRTDAPMPEVLRHLHLDLIGGGRVVRWIWVNFQCRGVLQF